MDILVVDGNLVRLSETENVLHRMFPEASVIAESDALMAGKYAFENPVDILFAAWNMKRMDGLQTADFVRSRHPMVMTFMMACPENYSERLAFGDEADGFFREPLDEADLLRALAAAKEIRRDKTGRRARLPQPIKPERKDAK